MMETLLIRSLVFLMALGSYGLATPSNFCEQEKVTILKQLVEIQREKGDALKEMVQTQQSVGEDKLQTLEEKLNKLEGRLDVSEAQKVDKFQALEESQTELSLALNKLVVNLNQVLDVNPVLNKLEGRFDAIEAKMDTQADKMKNILEAAQCRYKEGLQSVEDKLELAQGNHEEGLQLVKDTLELAQVNHEEGLQRLENKLELAQINHEEGLQRLKDKLEAAELRHDEVLQRLEALEHQVEEQAAGTEMSPVGCRPPFETFGKDCLYLHTEYMRWDEAQRYCQNLGASLFIPTAKEGFQNTNGALRIPDQHPPVIDFLLEKLMQLSRRDVIYTWIGAVEDDGTRTWTSGKELQRSMSRLAADEELSCIRLYVHNERKYQVRSLGCKGDSNAPLCQKQ